MLVAGLDFITGYEISFSIFYLAPVGLAAWFLNKATAQVFAVVSTLIWLAMDIFSGNTYSHMAIHFWNALVRFGFFLVVLLLLGKARQLMLLQESLAQQDGLTGLFNARAFKSSCVNSFEVASRYKHSLAIGYIDLDGFKSVNDRYGHSTGDQVLKGVANVLSARVRKSDTCARLGGDEFAVLLPETSMPGAKFFFTELHGNLIAMAKKNRWPIGFSIGVAVFVEPNTNVEEAIKQADVLMYQVKRSGKNNIAFAEFHDKPEDAQAEAIGVEPQQPA